MSADIRVTWLGHATFLIRTPEGKTVLVDPWLAGNPKCPREFHEVESDAILITHGHSDHCGDAVSAAARCSGRVAGMVELTWWLSTQGIAETKLVGFNKGGTIDLDEAMISVTMTDARHSSSADDGHGKPLYLGEPNGFVVRFSNGFALYNAGDTCLFGDMQWIGTLSKPDAAILPIGDFYTMDPFAAAHACKLLGVKTVVPCHYGTFPALRGTPGQLAENLKNLGLGVKVLAPEPGTEVILG